MDRKASPRPARMATLNVAAEIDALEAANGRDRQSAAEMQVQITNVQARIAGRQETIAFLRGIQSRVVGDTIVVEMLDADPRSEPSGFAEAVVSRSAIPASRTPNLRKPTQKLMSLAVLAEAPDTGLMAIEIIDGARERFPNAKRIERTSLSPLLAKMASSEEHEALVVHHKDEARWSLTPAGRDELERLKRLKGDF